jgi:hypothetical protein
MGKDAPVTVVNGKSIEWGQNVDKIAAETVPYRDGGNCIFFATQEAYQYFYGGGGFAEEEFNRFRSGIHDFVVGERERTGVSTGIADFAMSVAFMVPYLAKKQIAVTAIKTTGQNIGVAKRTYAELENFPFVDATSESKFKPPFMVMTESSSGGPGHVFFVRDKNDYGGKVEIHMHPGDEIVAFVNVEKAKQ